MSNEMVSLGEFTLKSQEVVLSDPQYSLEDKEGVIISPIDIGLWRGFVLIDYSGSFAVNEELHAYKESLVVNNKPKSDLFWEILPDKVPVDSGQAGIFDTATFQNENYVKTKPSMDTGNLWYDMCCDITSDKVRAGIVEGGVISSAGLGDGRYKVFVSKNNAGKIVAIKIVFEE